MKNNSSSSSSSSGIHSSGLKLRVQKMVSKTLRSWACHFKHHSSSNTRQTVPRVLSSQAPAARQRSSCCREPQPAAVSIPGSLLLALTDTERLNPTYILVPHATAGAAASAAARSLQHATAAAAARLLNPAPALLAAAASNGTLTPQHQQQGLPLISPQTHWLLGDYAKAEAQYKVPGTSGSPVISIPGAAGLLYALCLIVDHQGQRPVFHYLPVQQQQDMGDLEPQSSLTASAVAATAASCAPKVYQRYGRPGRNTSSRRQQLQLLVVMAKVILWLQHPQRSRV